MAKRPRRIWAGCQDVPRAIKPINPVVDDSNWRERLQSLRGVGFDDNAKLKFLHSLDKNGKIGLACQAAGISPPTWRKHARLDPDFLEAVEHTVTVFNARRAAFIEKQAMDGFDEVVFGPNGERDVRKRYETQLRVMILKAADKEMYADHSTVDVNVQGGAFIVPATLDPADWEAQFAEQQEKFVFDTVGENAFKSEGERTSEPVVRPRLNE